MTPSATRAIAACAFLAGTLPAFAQTAPSGWETTPDGPRHEVTRLVCPEELGDLKFASVALDGDAAMLGRCHYKGESLDAWLRIREYVKGEGESGMAIQNDETLMNPRPGEDVPVATFRVTPGEADDGRSYSDFVITARVGDLLADCIGRTYQGDEAASNASQEFVMACSKLVDSAD